MSKIYTVGFDVDIIEFLADSLMKDYNQDIPDLSSVAIIFPGKRPQFYLRKTLTKRIKKAFLPPQVFSIEEFVQYMAKKNVKINPAPSYPNSTLHCRRGGVNQQQESYQPICLIDACFLIYKIIQNLRLNYLDWQK